MPVFRSLSNSRQYREVLRTGRRARKDGVTVACARSVRGEALRVGLVAKVGRGGAVARNRARRRLREAVAAAAPSGGFDVVVGADAEAAEMEFQELVSQVKEALVAVGVPCG
jgi:ribonuclease P protein component